jgi:hypothetical protein
VGRIRGKVAAGVNGPEADSKGAMVAVKIAVGVRVVRYTRVTPTAPSAGRAASLESRGTLPAQARPKIRGRRINPRRR